MIIQEYRGARKLVYAEVTADSADTYTTGTVKELAGLAELTKDTDTNTDTHYYDNDPAINITSVGEDKIKLNVSALSNETLADITGQVYDAETDTIFEGTATQKYFAIGYITGKIGGAADEEMLVWRYKGTFSIPSVSAKTKDDGTDAEGQEIEFTGINTKKIWSEVVDSTGKARTTKGIQVPLGDVTETEFFAKVFTPTDIAAKKNG